MSFLTARRAQTTDETTYVVGLLQDFSRDGLEALSDIPGLVEDVDALANQMAPALAAADVMARNHANVRRDGLPMLQRYSEMLRDAVSFKPLKTDAQLASYFKAALRARTTDGENDGHAALERDYPGFFRAVLAAADSSVRAYWARQQRIPRPAGR